MFYATVFRWPVCNCCMLKIWSIPWYLFPGGLISAVCRGSPWGRSLAQTLWGRTFGREHQEAATVAVWEAGGVGLCNQEHRCVCVCSRVRLCVHISGRGTAHSHYTVVGECKLVYLKHCVNISCTDIIRELIVAVWHHRLISMCVCVCVLDCICSAPCHHLQSYADFLVLLYPPWFMPFCVVQIEGMTTGWSSMRSQEKERDKRCDLQYNENYQYNTHSFVLALPEGYMLLSF